MTQVLIGCLLVVGLIPGLLVAWRGSAAWTITFAGALALIAWAAVYGVASPYVFGAVAGTFAAVALVFGVRPLRRLLFSVWLMKWLTRRLPRMSDTERTALEAGTVWWEGTLFSGRPDWQRLFAFKAKKLSPAEEAFLDGPVEQLCVMLNDWQISRTGDLPPDVWRFIKQQGFFGLVIPKSYGGLGFSARAHSEVVMKIASRSITVAVTVMVPNSLGPAELLLHYGTNKQKQRYLPRLARGQDVPCFALTEPEAGSDAAATRSEGVVCRGTFAGRDVLGMKLNWRKRYITLSPIATLIGLAFRLRDPDHLLGDQEDLGITCALVPAELPGVEIGRRHNPMGVPFQIGPTNGRDVFVPLDAIIGGPDMAGEGWRMLMETLSIGRSISLPALSVGGAKLAARLTSAYGLVRKQFGLPIGRFEGVEERISRIAGLTYLMDAARRLTLGAVDAGEKPSVISAIVKAYLTEGMRVTVNDALDVRAGAGICRGPRNVLAGAYMALPIGITVEGANILTRSLIVYGQGSIRCHPFVKEQLDAVASGDVVRFDRAFFGHVGFVCQNAMRALVFILTGGRLAAPVGGGVVGKYARAITRMSTRFALVSDAAMATLGGELKRREKISGRLADAFAWMYLGAAALKRFVDEGRPERDLPFVRWSCDHALWQSQEALRGVLDNLPSRLAAWLLRPLVFPFGARLRPPSDKLGAAVARALMDDDAAREGLTSGIFVPPASELGLGKLEAVRAQAIDALPIEKMLRDAVSDGRLARQPRDTLPERAMKIGVITAEEHDRLARLEVARSDVIQVDDFDAEMYVHGGQSIPASRESKRQAAPRRRRDTVVKKSGVS